MHCSINICALQIVFLQIVFQSLHSDQWMMESMLYGIAVFQMLPYDHTIFPFYFHLTCILSWTSSLKFSTFLEKNSDAVTFSHVKNSIPFLISMAKYCDFAGHFTQNSMDFVFFMIFEPSNVWLNIFLCFTTQSTTHIHLFSANIVATLNPDFLYLTKHWCLVFRCSCLPIK